MISHRKAREVALQILFQRSFREMASVEELFNSFVDHFKIEQSTQEYAFFLTSSVIDHEEKINQKIQSLSDHWKLERMALIDRVLLQMAIFELCLSQNTQTPPKLCVTDILDLAKKYSSVDSKSFINGILDPILNQNG